MGMADNCREMIRDDLESLQLLNQPLREWLGMTKVFEKIETASEVYHGQPEGLIEIHDCTIADYKSPLGKDFVMKVTAPSCDDVAQSLNRIDRSGVKIVGFKFHGDHRAGGNGKATIGTSNQGDLESYAADQAKRIAEIEAQIDDLLPSDETKAIYEDRCGAEWYLDASLAPSDVEATHMGAHACCAGLDADQNPFNHSGVPELHPAWAMGWHKAAALRAELDDAAGAVIDPPAREPGDEAYTICEGGTILIGPGVDHFLVPFSDKARATATIDLAANSDGSILMAVSYEIEPRPAVESVLSVESRCYPSRQDALIAAHGILTAAVKELPETAKRLPTKRAEAAFLDLDDWLNAELAAITDGVPDDDAEGEGDEADVETLAEMF